MVENRAISLTRASFIGCFFGANKEFLLQKAVWGTLQGPIQKPEKKYGKKNEVEKSGKSVQNHTLHMQRPCPRRPQTRDTTYFRTNSGVTIPCFQRPKSDENLICRACQGPRPMEIISKTHRNHILNENRVKPRDFFDKGFFYRVFFDANKEFLLQTTVWRSL